MTSSFPDHFSSTAAGYASYRPRYPATLFEWLSRITPDREMVWDCGTGTGQAAVGLAEHFGFVVASDASTTQLAHAAPHPRVRYAAMPAERSALASGSAGLVTVAQALHWFDTPAFFAEARRVLAPRGVVAAWSYGLMTLNDPALDEVMEHFHGETVGPYWPRERRLVDEGYRALEFPFTPLRAPTIAMEAHWTLEQLAGYVSTWSAVQHARTATASDPVADLVAKLRAVWGTERMARRRVEWPLTLRAGRV